MDDFDLDDDYDYDYEYYGTPIWSQKTTGEKAAGCLWFIFLCIVFIGWT